MLATLSASAMRSWVCSVFEKEQELEIQKTSLISFKVMLAAVHNITTNALDYFQAIKINIELDGTIKEDDINLLKKTLKEADDQMKILDKMQNPSDSKSYSGIVWKK
jgi:hypothetical protein